MDEATKESLRRMGHTVQQLQRAILSGWPLERDPTDEESTAIMSVYGELSMQMSTMFLKESERWRLAGQLIARIARDQTN